MRQKSRANKPDQLHLRRWHKSERLVHFLRAIYRGGDIVESFLPKNFGDVSTGSNLVKIVKLHKFFFSKFGDIGPMISPTPLV